MANDNRLLQRAQTFEPGAFEDIFEHYFDPIYRYLFHHVRHQETAEDMAQEVFQKLISRLQEGKGPTNNLKAWLYQVAHNIVIDESRRQKVRKHEELVEDILKTTGGMSRAGENAILTEQVHQALEALTDKQRDVITLKFFEGLTNGEIADILDISERAVLKLQQRALAVLKNEFAALELITESV